MMMKQSFSTHATSKEWKTVAMPVHQKVFVDRYAEVFDIFGTSFLSSANDPSTKFFLPVATQIMGTGKSALGQHAISVLHRPRESPEDEDDVASRLASSSVLLESVDNKSLLQRAKALPHDETLVCRALREYARTTANLTVAQADARVDTLKQSQTVLIQCETVSPDLPRFDQAIADSIYRNVTGTTWPGSLPPSVHSVHDHLRDYGSLFFFFDEVADFEKDMYSRYFESAMAAKPDKPQLYHALITLSKELSTLRLLGPYTHYLAGRSSWLGLRVLSGDRSPIYSQPIVLRPLEAKDIDEMIRRTDDPVITKALTGDTQDKSGIDERRRILSRELAEGSGGVGRVITYALDTLKRKPVHPLTSKEEILAALDAVSKRPDVEDTLRPIDTSTLNNPQLIASVAHLAASNLSFRLTDKLELDDGSSIPWRSAVESCGLSWALASSSSSTSSSVNPLDHSGTGDRFPLLRVRAGTWHLRLFSNLYKGQEVTAAITALAKTTFTSRGQAFEKVCLAGIKAALLDRQFRKGAVLGDVLPFLRGTFADSATPIFKGVEVLPKVTLDAKKTKTGDGSDGEVLRPSLSILPERLPSRLQELSPGTVAEAAPLSASQDLYLRLDDGVVGWAAKALKGGVSVHLLQQELKKVPLPAAGGTVPFPFVLVLAAVKLSKALQTTPEGGKFTPGTWTYDGIRWTLDQGRNQGQGHDQGQSGTAVTRLVVPEGCTVIVLTSTGLAELLGGEHAYQHLTAAFQESVSHDRRPSTHS